MSTCRIKSVWTAFITAFLALLASLGLVTAQATAAAGDHAPGSHGRDRGNRNHSLGAMGPSA